MKVHSASFVVAVLFATFTFSTQLSAQADTFGTSGNEFTIDFVNISNAGNSADPYNGLSTYGGVPYEYRASTYEITQDAITKATASGMANVTAGAWTGKQPAATISWYKAAAFVNFLNTSSGKTAAYNLTYSGSWSMALWSSDQAWTAGGINRYRNKDAYYFLPSENEWYKAAYYNAAGTNYFLFPSAASGGVSGLGPSFGMSGRPIAVASGTNAGTAVYNGSATIPAITNPAIVDNAGGLSAYGTMGQGGNVWEWTESAYDGLNNSPSEQRTVRGGSWDSGEHKLRSTLRENVDPTVERDSYGFRVASVPEPSTGLLVVLGLGGLLFKRRKTGTL